MPFLDTRTFGGLCLVRMRMALNPPPSVRTAPLAISNPSLLVGSGSRMARIITAAPKRVIPPAISTAVHSLRESPAFNPSSRSDWLPGSIPTLASSRMTTWSRLRYAFASCASHPGSEVRMVRSVPSVAFTFVVTAAGRSFFAIAQMVRVDPEDNIWTADVGSHVVLKLSPEGRVLLALGRMRIPGDDVLHFNQPTDVAWDRDGNIYVTDGYGNSRVLKFDKYGRPLLGWGMKGSGPGQFDTPHTIVIDGDLVYVGDRENARIQIFDRNGQFLRQWSLGHPFGLVITPDHVLYMGDAIAGRILKIDQQGRVLGSFTGPQLGEGPHFDPHQIALAPDGSILTAEVLGWRAEKLRP